MDDGTTLLLDLPGLAVAEVVLVEGGGRVVHVVTADESASACPSCGVFSTSTKEPAALSRGTSRTGTSRFG